MIFPSPRAALQLSKILETHPVGSPYIVDVIRFSMHPESDVAPNWASFSAVLFPLDLLKQAMGFWRDTGTGISTRHAEFCLSQFDYLVSDSATTKAFCTVGEVGHRRTCYWAASSEPRRCVFISQWDECHIRTFGVFGLSCNGVQCCRIWVRNKDIPAREKRKNE
jgi:hypothetical protein